MENKFPHHECEIAQSEAANGVPFVRFWLHNNMVTVDGQKMGKSLNNFITLKQVFTGTHERLTRSYDPLAVRQLVLNSHYRSPIDFSDAALFAAQSGYNKITETVKAVRRQLGAAPKGQIDNETAEQLKQLKERFEAAMNDDLNTSIALSVIFELVRLANAVLQGADTTAETLDAIDNLFSRLGGDVLGVVRDEYPHLAATDDGLTDKLVSLLIEQRTEARKSKDFARADELRAELDAIGIVLEDKPDRTTWRRK
jgi:cysteinyl-tRNA synthetase